MTRSLNIHVDESAEAMAQRFLDAWHRAERGEAVEEHHVSFESWESLARVLTPKRVELLRHLHRHEVPSVAELARALGRDYKRVHADVEALASAGLVDRTPAACARTMARSGPESPSEAGCAGRAGSKRFDAVAEAPDIGKNFLCPGAPMERVILPGEILRADWLSIGVSVFSER